MKVARAKEQLKKRLSVYESARIEAERLLAKVLHVSTSDLIRLDGEALTTEKVEWLNQAVERRLSGEPLAYILETQGFFKQDFVVKKGVLVPRPETELIVETAVRLFSTPPVRFADLGCGSGCIGLSLLLEWPLAELTAIDASETATAVTQENASRLRVDNRCRVIHAPVEKADSHQEFQLIVANPPYIDRDDPRVEPNVRKFEPAQALFAADKGLAAIFSWSQWAWKALKPGGWWIVEIGAGQSDAASIKLNEIGFINLGTKKDLAGHARVICAQKSSEPGGSAHG